MTQAETIRTRIRARLLDKGISLSSWERTKGYTDGFVRKVVSRFAGIDKRPQKGKTLAIIEALELETGVKICG